MTLYLLLQFCQSAMICHLDKVQNALKLQENLFNTRQHRRLAYTFTK